MLNYANLTKTDTDEIVLDSGFEIQVVRHQGLVLDVVFVIDDSGLLTAIANDPIMKKSTQISISSVKLNKIDT